MKKFFCIIILIFTIFSCNLGPHPLGVKDKHLITVAVENTLKDYFKDIETNGLTAEFKYLDSTDQFFWVPPGYKKSLSFPEVKEAINTNAAKYKSIQNSWESLEINPLSKEHASYTGIIHSVMIDTAGDTSQIKLIETGIVRKTGPDWKLFNGQTAIIE